MPLIDRQRRLVEVGRIRLGVKKPTSSGGTRPAAIDTFRLTSRVRDRLQDAAALYGGTVAEWEGQWQLITDTDTLDVMIPPGTEVSQWYELWSGGGCQRRCDGETEHLGDQPCVCGETRECKTTSRVAVILPRIRGLGVWRLETHGEHAARELPGMVELVLGLGQHVPVVLRLDHRTVKREGVTQNFVVPVFDALVAPLALLGGEVPAGYTPIQPGANSSSTGVPAPRRERPQPELGPVTPPPPPEPIVVAHTLPAPPPRLEAVPDPIPPDVHAELDKLGAVETGHDPPGTPDPRAITEAQRKRLRALQTQRGITDLELKSIIHDVTGQESSRAVRRDQYEAIYTLTQAYVPDDDIFTPPPEAGA